MQDTELRRATYSQMKRCLVNLLGDLEILAGERIGPSDVSWQAVAGTASVSAEVLARQLRAAHLGNHEAGITFPSPSDCLAE